MSARHFDRGHARRGFALPAAIMALVLLSALVAGALYVSTEELRAGRADVASERSLAAAEAALAAAIVGWNTELNTTLAVGARGVVSSSRGTSAPDVDVTATRVQRTSVWMTSAARSFADGRPIPARHTIAASLRLVTPRVPLQAALTVGGMVMVRDGTISGADPAAPPGAGLACDGEPSADVAGLLVPDTLLACDETCAGNVPTGVTGTPPLAVSGPTGLTSDSSSALPGADGVAALARRASVGLAAGAYAPRPTVSGDVCDATDPMNWGDPGGGPCAGLFRIVHIRGDAVLMAGAVGQGVLLVDGTLRLEGGARFDGVVVAANDIEVTGIGSAINGVAFAKDADRSGASRVADGGTVRFTSCAVRRASLGVAQLVRTPGRWWAELR